MKQRNQYLDILRGLVTVLMVLDIAFSTGTGRSLFKAALSLIMYSSH